MLISAAVFVVAFALSFLLPKDARMEEFSPPPAAGTCTSRVPASGATNASSRRPSAATVAASRFDSAEAARRRAWRGALGAPIFQNAAARPVDKQVGRPSVAITPGLWCSSAMTRERSA